MSADPAGVPEAPPTAPPAGRLDGSPYESARAMRRVAPAAPPEPDQPAEGPPSFGVYRWDAVSAALHHDDLSASVYGEAMDLDDRYGRSLIGMDGSEHRAHRALLQPAFSRASVEKASADLDAPIRELVDQLAERGSADLVSELCEVFPARVLSRLLGLTDDDAPLLRAQAVVIGGTQPGEAVRVADDLFDRLSPVIDARRGPGAGEDLISLLANGEVDGRALTSREVFAQLRLLAIAGTDTVQRATSNLLAGVLASPDETDALRSDPSLVPDAVEEAVRWEAPAINVPRVAVRDTEVAGSRVPAGATVWCHLGSANRDEARWSHPDEFDPRRLRQSHAGFGIGAHACLGMHLARHVMAHTLTTVLDRLPGVRLSPDHPAPVITGDHVREPDHLHVTWS